MSLAMTPAEREAFLADLHVGVVSVTGAIAYRYLGQQFGDAYLSATEADVAGSVMIRMRPECWLSVDYAKQYG